METVGRFIEKRKNASEVLIAVPFWGAGAIDKLAIGNGQQHRIVCNLESDGCNPDVIGNLLTTEGVSIRTHSRLHAKIYTTRAFSIVGSSNASTNGLTEEDNTGWLEANIFCDDKAIVTQTNAFGQAPDHSLQPLCRKP